VCVGSFGAVFAKSLWPLVTFRFVCYCLIFLIYAGFFKLCFIKCFYLSNSKFTELLSVDFFQYYFVSIGMFCYSCCKLLVLLADCK